MMLPTWSEIGGHPELKMAAMKTQEVKIIFEPKELAKCLDRLPLHIQRRPTQI
jgi:ABC-type thiamine transport system ATPase subunit